MNLFLKVEFWQAMAAFAWPITVLIIALIFRKVVLSIFRRDQLKIKVAGMEISVAEATEQAGKGLSDLQERIALLEKNKDASQPQNSSSPSKKRDLKGYTAILWVDDYPSNNAFIIEKLESENIRIRKELSTDAAMAAFQTDSFDMVISDLGRVEASKDNPFAGLELARAMRAASIDLPLLIFAGRRGLENKNRLVGAGASDVTSSPVDVFKFVERHS